MTSTYKVDEFIAGQPEHIRNILNKIRNTIKQAVPQAEELVSYGMPAFRFYGIIAWYAPFKNHYSLFIRPKFIEIFKDDLKNYQLTKSAIRFPLNLPVQVDLINKIVCYIAKENIKKNGKN